MSPTSDNDSIHAIKGVAILGVVFQHVLSRRLDPAALNIVSLLPPLFSWCVLAFFAVSGWLHAMGQERQPKTLGRFVASRTQRILL